MDDYEKDREKGSYNPLLYRKNSLEGIGDLLYHNLADMMNAYDLLNMKKHESIIENIINCFILFYLLFYYRFNFLFLNLVFIKV